ncbi:hypothetical protein P278_19150 [Zhouia amylolytica AD3]|uniref:Uncharacterized protein n=1 Tax=Zhouia amylolytica AD3 TaxID=1286632 RepID=W2ULW1_9FLAO|nr:hypothetical protein P278_19150 [Zhouia amylolytica AD3]
MLHGSWCEFNVISLIRTTYFKKIAKDEIRRNTVQGNSLAQVHIFFNSGESTDP